MLGHATNSPVMPDAPGTRQVLSMWWSPQHFAACTAGHYNLKLPVCYAVITSGLADASSVVTSLPNLEQPSTPLRRRCGTTLRGADPTRNHPTNRQLPLEEGGAGDGPPLRARKEDEEGDTDYEGCRTSRTWGCGLLEPIHHAVPHGSPYIWYHQMARKGIQ